MKTKNQRKHARLSDRKRGNMYDVFEALLSEAIWNWSKHDIRLFAKPRKAAALKGWVRRRWRKRWREAEP